MTWADIVPNLLIGLREGLEAGLIISILLAAVRNTPAERAYDGARPYSGAPANDGASPGSTAPANDGACPGSTARPGSGAGPDARTEKASVTPVWLGVLAAIMLSGSFAAVLTFSADVLTSRAQDALDGLLSVFAVGLVTAMIFWMRRTAAGLAAQLRGDVARAATIGAGALTLTAFLAVGREGLETTLFLWSAARASGQTVGPIAGAAAGLAAAAALCWLLYRRAVRLNVGLFFNRTAIALIVIAAGVLAYGLGDLQDAGLLSGQRWIAFDLTAHVHPGSWWVSLITGVTDLSPKMTVLQVVAWISYLAVVVSAFVRADSLAALPETSTEGTAATPSARHATGIAHRWDRLIGRRPWALATTLVVAPAVAAGAAIAALPPASSASTSAVTVTRTLCAPGWNSATAGTQTFTVDNESGMAGEINLDDSSGDIVGEIETIGPGTSATLTATLGRGTYVFKCFMGSQAGTASQPVLVTATGRTATAGPPAINPVAVKPVTIGELEGPNEEYQAYAARQLTALAQAVGWIETDLRQDDLPAAKEDWLTAQLDWERVGASYDSFGSLGLAVDGLPDGLPGGVADKNFTGLHRLEYGLWHGQSATTLLPVATTLASDVSAVQRNLTSDDLAGDPTNLPIRAHEVLEDALRDHLSGIDDQGGGAAFAQTYADMQVTWTVLGYLAPLLNARQPGLPAIADGQLDVLKQALLATRINGQWESLSTASLSAREQVDAAIGAVLETLSAVPDLLEVPPVH